MRRLTPVGGGDFWSHWWIWQQQEGKFLARGVQLDVADLVVAIAITQGGGSDFGL